ncbi:MAG: 4'-phosphopantetheinyl transferase superfamily protein [Proteobacteria bacterium]|nr:MAG: 4'-phosphopantetheinyl transferase superfamily protein [Pseudomonadota bacterium]
MDRSESLTNTLRSNLGSSSLEVFLGDGNLDRVAIRKFLLSRYQDEFPSHDETLNLNERPVGQSISVSISHCPSRSGVLVADRAEGSFGLDLENPARVKEAVARRVAVAGEMETTPSFAHLWVAKEAFFKALPEALQPITISELQISDWVIQSESVWKFAGLALPTGGRAEGVVTLLGDDLIVGAARVANL